MSPLLRKRISVLTDERFYSTVPSPRDCVLRNKKIFLREDLSCEIANSSAMTPKTRVASTDDLKRDAVTQTVLTFPWKLPKEVEDVLRKYQLIDSCDDTRGCDESKDGLDESNRSMMDISTLRRKLFINRPDSPDHFDSGLPHLEVHLSPAPKTPELNSFSLQAHSATLKGGDDSFGSDMFGELSPIRPPSPYMTSNEFSLISDRPEKTPRMSGKKMKKKNLSESFCQFDSDEFKKNDFEEILPQYMSGPKRFGRFDSGFPGDEDSKFSSEYMQF